MKKELQEKLRKYAASAVVIGTGIAGASAQIVYTDIVDFDIDDDNNAGGFTLVGLDLDNDATNDFIIACRDTTTTARVRYTLVAPANSVNRINGETLSYDYALALDNGMMIDNTVNWIAATNTMAYNVDSANPYSENWNGVTDKYLGLEFQTAGTTYYGWCRLDVQAIGDVLTIKDYAYNSTAATGIAAGDMGSADVNEYTLDNLVHFINQTNNTVLVKVNGNLEGGLVNVISMTGQSVSTGAVVNNAYTVDMNGLQAGIYMINVTFGKETVSRKMTVR
ncbi:MAG: T9SS type A sorting domain-containing protein [Crocinitomicaceae bacterium]